MDVYISIRSGHRSEHRFSSFEILLFHERMNQDQVALSQGIQPCPGKLEIVENQKNIPEECARRTACNAPDELLDLA